MMIRRGQATGLGDASRNVVSTPSRGTTFYGEEVSIHLQRPTLRFAKETVDLVNARTTQDDRRSVRRYFEGALDGPDLPLRSGGYNEENYALNAYTRGLYQDVNRVLRGGTAAEKEGMRPLIKAVAAGLSRMHVHVGTVYRSVTLTPTQLAGYVPGAQVTEPTFLSTSINRLAAVNRFQPVLFVIENKGMGKELSNSRFYREREVLFPPNTRFKVSSVTKDGEMTVISMSQL